MDIFSYALCISIATTYSHHTLYIIYRRPSCFLHIGSASRPYYLLTTRTLHSRVVKAIRITFPPSTDNRKKKNRSSTNSNSGIGSYIYSNAPDRFVTSSPPSNTSFGIIHSSKLTSTSTSTSMSAP